MQTLTRTSILLAGLACAVPAAAQTSSPAQASNLGDLRHHIYVMEGALARAVDYGAKQLNREILSVMPGVFMLEGEARARGVHLDGYGVFFDVRVPMMRQSMVWSMRMMLNQDEAQAQANAREIREYLKSITDPRVRTSLEAKLNQLERQAAPAAAMGRPVSGGQVGANVVVPDPAAGPGVGAGAAAGMAAPKPQTPPADSVWAKDPNRAYTEAVTRALVDAMVDYSAPMAIGPEQWLTVAARDDEGRDSLSPQDPMEEVVTMIYRIKGSDLQAYRRGEITRDEVRKRVQISQF
ncbi:MAG TPA: hypothetical protein VFP85_09605 [Vicinamibacterales bacterium]|nr:hypothetical protein [Vicinamibacterales bacterium]